MDLTLIQTLWKFEEWVNPDFVQQVKEETIERYVNTLEKIGKKVGFLELHSHLEELITDDLESTKFQEIQIWYQEEKEELQKLRDLRVELEKKIKIIHN
jgi:phosphoribosylanthranilate isomerase